MVTIRSSHQRCFVQWRPCNFFKKETLAPVNFGKFLRTHFFTEHLQRPCFWNPVKNLRYDFFGKLEVQVDKLDSQDRRKATHWNGGTRLCSSVVVVEFE